MHELLPILAVFAYVPLSGCSPAVDAEFHNATGQSIVVTNLAQPEFKASISPSGSASVNVFVLRSGRAQGFSIASGSRVWIYRRHTRFLASVSPENWQRGPFESKRLHLSVDSHGSIYLLSSSGTPISQPAGFPVNPDEQKKLSKRRPLTQTPAIFVISADSNETELQCTGLDA